MNTQNIFSRLFLFCCFILSSLISGCSNELDTIDTEKQQGISTNDNDLHVLQLLGFETSDIVELESYYLIQGDILFEKSKLSSYDKIQTRQAYHTTGLIEHPNQRTITVGIDSSIPTSGVDNWREEILESINLWNPLSNLRLAYTTDANPDILIRSDDINPLPYYAIAAAEFPMNGKPGSTIRINLDYNNKVIPRLQKIYNMVHELGHCFGLRHTNWKSLEESGANHISGTPTSDPNSIMNGGTAESSWNGFSENDRSAISTLYPTVGYISLIGFPGNIISFGIDKFRISVSCSHPIVSYRWTITGGYMINSQGDHVINDNGSSVTAVFGSPVTSSISVYITTVYGEKYYLAEDYQTHTFTLDRVN